MTPRYRPGTAADMLLSRTTQPRRRTDATRIQSRPDLLWGHIRYVPKVLPGLVRCRRLVLWALLLGGWAARPWSRPSLTESRNFSLDRVVMKMFAGFDVAMHDALGMGGVERVAIWIAASYRVVVQGPAMMRCFSVSPAVEKLHGDEGPPRCLPISEPCDIGMVQTGGERVPPKASRVLGSCANSGGRNLSATKRPSSISSAL